MSSVAAFNKLGADAMCSSAKDLKILFRGEDRSLTESLLFDDRVEWAEQQFDKVLLTLRMVLSRFQVRVKRGSVGLLRVGESIPEELVELWKEEEELERFPLHSSFNTLAQAQQARSPRRNVQ